MKPVVSKTVKTIEVKPVVSDLAVIKKNPDFLASNTQITPLKLAIDKLVVKDQKTSEEMTDLVAQAKRVKNRAEEIRKTFVDPLNQHVKLINSLFKTVTEPASQAEEAGRRKLSVFMNEQFRQAQLKAEKETQKAQAQAVRRGEDPDEIAEVEVEYIAGAQTETASTGTRTVPKFKLAGKLADVDPAYLVLDEVKIRSVLKAGVREIKGLEIWEEKEVTIRV